MTRAMAVALLPVLGLACGARTNTSTPAPARLEGRAPDWNGDGRADLAVGAPGRQPEEIGRVFVWYGAADGLRGAPGLAIDGPDVVGAGFGEVLASVGDLNGDGFAELAVGAPGDAAGRGAVYLYRGGETGLEGRAAWRLEGADARGALGSAIATAGDVNGDGFADLLIGAPGAGSGKALLYLGAAQGMPVLALSLSGATDGAARLGAALDGGRDVNGDRLPDLLVGAPGAGGGAGAALLYAGAVAKISPVPAASVAGAPGQAGQAGAALAMPGDLDGDGLADIAVASPRLGNDGEVRVHFGARGAGLGLVPPVALPAPDPGAGFGATLVATGDVDGDGGADLLVAATGFASWTGRVYVYSGRGLPAAPILTITGPLGSHAGFGRALAGGGDIDGDARIELVVGAPDAQRVLVYRGGQAAPADTPTWTLAAPAGSPRQFGAALALTPTR